MMVAIRDYIQMRARADAFVEDFLDRFSMNDTERRKDLGRRSAFNESTPCYKTTIAEFNEKCIAPQVGKPYFLYAQREGESDDSIICFFPSILQNAYNSMFKQVFARACTYPEQTTESILKAIEEVCRDKFMSGSVDWLPFYASISLKQP